MKDYYSKYCEEFIDGTINCNMKELYTFFEKYLPNKSTKILDLGFGSGRDSLYFQKKYDVYSLDPAIEFCEHGKKIGLKNIICSKVEDMPFIDEFDGIWACASLLHISSQNIIFAFEKCFNALKKEGIMYCSFKYGNFEGERNNRYYLDLTEERLKEFVEKTQFEIVNIIVTDDVRKDKKERWINAILRKS